MINVQSSKDQTSVRNSLAEPDALIRASLANETANTMNTHTEYATFSQNNNQQVLS
jgi:hypothetical protein